MRGKQQAVAKNVIELNGKRYDALTGAYLGAGKGEPYKPASQSATVKGIPKPSGKHIDGFIRQSPAKSVKAVKAAVQPVTTKPTVIDFSAPQRVTDDTHKPVMAGDVHKKVSKAPAVPRPAKPAKPVAAAKPKAIPAASAPTRKIAVNRTPATTKAHSPQHAKTLMRHVVKKPAHNIKPAIRTQAPAEVAAIEPSSILFKPSITRIDEKRLKRAKAIAKASGIQHFMPTKPDYSPNDTPIMARSFDSAVPVIAVQPVPAHAHGKLTTHKAATQHSPHTDIFEAAIAHADSHKQPKHPAKRASRSRRLINTMAIVGAFLVIGGFITYLNIPNIKLRVASVQAGFKAEMPEYKPTGYALQGGVQRTGNTVSLKFQSGENQYTITQQPSVWNSQTLEENTLALSNSRHKTVEAGGRTIFIYNGSNAVWVNGGIRYDVTTNAPLSTDDISRLATSL